jgi:23S rRNA (uracil-5-)-methyltransferase RumA
MTERVKEAACPHAEVCGGCVYQGVAYEEQLEIKNGQVLDLLYRNQVRCGEYRGVIPAPRIHGYRNKMEYSFGDEVKDGPMTLGLHRSKSFLSVINTEGCRIVPPDFNLIRDETLNYMRNLGHGFYRKRFHSGFLRALVLRRGERTGELLVNLITTDEESLDEAAFVDFLLALPTEEKIVSILHTFFNGKADTAGRDSLRLLHGREWYTEEMLGLRFKVHAFSFFQTNTAAVEGMFGDALGMIPDLREKHACDVYCGTGAISLTLAKGAKRVTGIEIVQDSVLAARENAALNGIENCEFLCGDALAMLEELPARPDFISVDPPRMGMHPKALRKILSYDLPELLYISCNPKTFSENAAVLQENGYKIDQLQAYDNFPYTKHIELAARIIRL